MSDDLLDDIALASLQFRGAATRPQPPIIEYARDLTREDIDVLNNVPVGSKIRPIAQMRHTHHALARLIASGKRVNEAAAITGHSFQRAYDLNSGDPAFRELVAHYRAVGNQQYMDTAARLAMLGIATIEELMERLETGAAKFSNRELMELAKVTGASAEAQQTKRSGGAGSGVTVNVSFVSPKAPTEPFTIDMIEGDDAPQLEPPK